MRSGCLSPVLSGRGVALITHLHLVQKLKEKNRAVLLFSLWAFMACSRAIFTLYPRSSIQAVTAAICPSLKHLPFCIVTIRHRHPQAYSQPLSPICSLTVLVFVFHFLHRPPFTLHMLFYYPEEKRCRIPRNFGNCVSDKTMHVVTQYLYSHCCESCSYGI
jgi:hypothetical protein